MPADGLDPADPAINRILIAQLAIPATFDEVRAALAALMAGPVLAGVPPDDRGMTELVLAEAMNNIVEHAYADTDEGEITLTLWQAAGEVACRITDRGTAMPDSALPEGRLAPLGEGADLPEGGFGWFLIRTLSRDLRYARHGTLNELTFVLANQQYDPAQPVVSP
ncbi:MAG: ATP-binding protein [Rhodobacteraceae bacterium]|jgi:serine/threonine-protein kinase RsbW|nr:ATP-binding protein [Paracoccaceae bacterium]